ncbi:hypothetical protein JD844_019017 [Phrynosoma platyrhinos]|uniref:Synaptonemal complex protein 2 n=1 Tax=Phrynosoma platyrhinos TaxID=52577 RepID=A0ABQ7SPC9_PHRPL|nr:hypothetical protein JD844_019017 [Phrynosoma platyrhinos]
MSGDRSTDAWLPKFPELIFDRDSGAYLLRVQPEYLGQLHSRPSSTSRCQDHTSVSPSPSRYRTSKRRHSPSPSPTRSGSRPRDRPAITRRRHSSPSPTRSPRAGGTRRRLSPSPARVSRRHRDSRRGWGSPSPKKNQNRSSGDLKTTTFLNITTKHLMDDVYNFNISGFDEPTIKLGIQEFHVTKLEATKLEATTDLSEKMYNRTNKNKKHLFSDTDTEYRGDDTKTDISWLRESNRKPKPHLVDYSRMKKQKKSKILEAKKTSPSMSVRRTFQQTEVKNDMASISKNQGDSDRGKQAQPTRLKQQRKAALVKKSYKELSDSETDSEEESSEHLLKKGTLKQYPEPKSIKKKPAHQLKVCQSIVSSETTKGNLVNQPKRSTKSGPEKQMELSSLPSFESPASPEILRCLRPQSCDRPLRYRSLLFPEVQPPRYQHSFVMNPSPSSIPRALGSEVDGAALDVEDDPILKEHPDLVYNSISKCYLMPVDPQTLQSCATKSHVATARAQVHRAASSEPPPPPPRHQSLHLRPLPDSPQESRSRSVSPQSQGSHHSISSHHSVSSQSPSPDSDHRSVHNFSSLTTRKNFTSNEDADITNLEKKIYDVDEATSTKHYPLNKSSDIELKGFSENPMESRGEASTSVSQSSTPSKEESYHEEPLAHIHESGPTVHTNFKRLYHEDTEADSDEEEIRREEMKTKLLPRKLFKTDENTYKVSESISTLSINDTSVFDGEGWDADTSSIGMICQKSRTKRMDSFTKQSLKTSYQHMNTMHSELHKHRAKQLENLHSCLIKEIESFERDSQTLRNMEKDFSNFSKKQSETFSTYNKNEQQRFQNLKISFEKNIYGTADCEKTFFASKMHQMKADMKGIQERFLKEMHEEELLNVRKGLQSLFMDKNRNF